MSIFIFLNKGDGLMNVLDHFPHVGKMVAIGSKATRNIEGYDL